VGMKLVLIPPGEFDMGSTPDEIAAVRERAKKANASDDYVKAVPSEAPRHRVRIGKPLYLGIYQVTQGEYQQVMGVNPSTYTEKQVDASVLQPPLSEELVKSRADGRKKVLGKDTSRHPVEIVSWSDCVEFCRRLSAMPAEQAAQRQTYRLPSEAEWEYACRAGTTTRWSCGDDEAQLLECAWLKENADGMTHAVGQRKPNAWGLYDMHGNVWQWCSDHWTRDYYQLSPLCDPQGPSGGLYRVARGGCHTRDVLHCRSAFRLRIAPSTRNVSNGFRVAVGVFSPNVHSGRDAAAYLAHKVVAGMRLTSEQIAGLQDTQQEFVPQIQLALDKADVLTPAQIKARREAVAAARAAGKVGNDVRDAMEAAGQLSDEQKASMAASHAEQKELGLRFLERVKALLTPEQWEQVDRNYNSRAARRGP
jgi:formylglycine-generating enzyme required for sulfatase activity